MGCHKTVIYGKTIVLSWFRALMPREDRFFDLFDAHALTVVEAAEALEKVLAGGPELEQHCSRIVELEDKADRITADVLLAVRKSFITPFDRGDITTSLKLCRE